MSAGLVNNATGTVVKVIYNNADVQALLDGQHPPAYCIIVNFLSFVDFLLLANVNFQSKTHIGSLCIVRSFHHIR